MPHVEPIRWIAAVASAVAVALLAAGSHAAAQAVALYEGDGVTLEIVTDDAGTGQQTGTITFKGNTYPFTAVANAGGGAAGTFEADQHRYSFNILPRDGGRLLFATGSRQYTLEPMELPPPPFDPMDDDAAARRTTLTLGAENDPAYQQLKQAATHYAEADFAAAYTLVRPLAERGHLGAAYLMGLGEQLGHLGEPDMARAAAWYRFAARGEHPGALFNLQGLYREDPERAGEAGGLLRRAALAGHPRAMGEYGAAVLEGIVQDVPAAEGLAWLHLAADRGDAAAAANLELAEASASAAELDESRRLADQALRPAVEAADRPDLVLDYHAYLTEE